MGRDELTQEHRDLLAEAEELGLDTLGYTVSDANLDGLRRAIQRETQRKVKEAQREREAAQVEEHESRSAFDEVMGETRGVLVRIVEWTEWLPMTPSEHFPQLGMQTGVTGFEAGENEKVVDIQASRTGQVKEVDKGDEGQKRYALYAFQATLAQNTRTDLIAGFIALQGGDEDGRTIKGHGVPHIIAPNGEPPSGLNRAQRRRK